VPLLLASHPTTFPSTPPPREAAHLDVSESVVAHWERPATDRRAGRRGGPPAGGHADRPDHRRRRRRRRPRSLIQLRLDAGLKQDRLAAQAGLTRTKYSSLERGEVASLSHEDAARLAKILGVDPT